MKTALILISCIAALNSFGQEWKETLNDARREYKNGNYKEALKYYKRAEQIAPNDVDLSQEIGQTAYRANDFGTAAENFERQANNADTKEKEIKARTSLGESRMKQQDFQSAVDTYKQILRLDPDNEKARQRLVEAKRLLEQQKKQQQKQPDKNDQQQDSKDQKNNNQKDQKDQKDSKDKQQNQNQQDQQSQKQQGEQKKLQNKETERKLDEFSKQEMNTKKRLDGSKGTTGGKRARKDW